VSSCPYETRGETCRCIKGPSHASAYTGIAPSRVAAGEKLGDVRVMKNGPFKGRRYIKTRSGWQRVREAR